MGSCFVIMGFGEKTDFQSNPQRVLNLNRTYEDIIKPVVEEAGHTCVRADEIIHSTVIDKPMYDNLLSADLVIADLSTANVNAVYELGVRHALRPQRTIVLAEKNFSFPFDLNHLSILKYEHLGKEIGFKEVMRVRERTEKKDHDADGQSRARQPGLSVHPLASARQPSQGAGDGAARRRAPPRPPLSRPTRKASPNCSQAFAPRRTSVKAAEDWALPLALLKRLKTMQPDDPYILQQLALATYKFQQPDKKTSLINAKNILNALAPQTSSDAETVGLWGAIHKRLWDETQKSGGSR